MESVVLGLWEGEMVRDCRAETVHASIWTEEVACAGWGCWDGGGTEL
jgi:hypothetical protein